MLIMTVDEGLLGSSFRNIPIITPATFPEKYEYPSKRQARSNSRHSSSGEPKPRLWLNGLEL